LFDLNTLTQHLKEAIALNSVRKSLYAKRTANRSLRLSRALILFERAAIPVARWIDRKASRFQKMGIPIIANDLVPMHPLPSYDTPPLYHRQATKTFLHDVRRSLKTFGKRVAATVEQTDFMSAAQTAYDLLQQIRKTEEEHQCHLAMTRHLIESIGLGALHAPQYAEMSRRATVPLSQKFIRIQLLGLSLGLWLDKQAQSLHLLGAGILVNDLPHIPFESEFNKLYLNG